MTHGCYNMFITLFQFPMERVKNSAPFCHQLASRRVQRDQSPFLNWKFSLKKKITVDIWWLRLPRLLTIVMEMSSLPIEIKADSQSFASIAVIIHERMIRIFDDFLFEQGIKSIGRTK